MHSVGGSKSNAVVAHVKYKSGGDGAAHRLHPAPKRAARSIGVVFLACVSAVLVASQATVASGFVPTLCVPTSPVQHRAVNKCIGLPRSVGGQRAMMPRMQFDAEKGTDQILKDITEVTSAICLRASYTLPDTDPACEAARASTSSFLCVESTKRRRPKCGRSCWWRGEATSGAWEAARQSRAWIVCERTCTAWSGQAAECLCDA